MSCVKYRVRDQHMLALLLLQLIVSNCTNEGHEKHESVMGFFESRILFFFHILKDAPTLSRYPVTDAVSLTHAFHGPFWCSFRMNCTENRANSVRSKLNSWSPLNLSPLPKNTAHSEHTSIMALHLSSYLSQKCWSRLDFSFLHSLLLFQNILSVLTLKYILKSNHFPSPLLLLSWPKPPSSLT